MKMCLYCLNTYDENIYDYNGYCCKLHYYNKNEKIFKNDLLNKILTTDTAEDSFFNLYRCCIKTSYQLTTLLIDNILTDNAYKNNLLKNDTILQSISKDELLYLLYAITDKDLKYMLSNMDLTDIFFENFIYKLRTILQKEKIDIIESFAIANKLQGGTI